MTSSWEHMMECFWHFKLTCDICGQESETLPIYVGNEESMDVCQNCIDRAFEERREWRIDNE